MRLGGHDVYLNVAGGLKITEPACDLAAAAALLSSLSGVALPFDSVYFGEVSLSGAVRFASHSGLRLKEAGKLGFKRCVIPAMGELEKGGERIDIDRIAHVQTLTARFSMPDTDAED